MGFVIKDGYRYSVSPALVPGEIVKSGQTYTVSLGVTDTNDEILSSGTEIVSGTSDNCYVFAGGEVIDDGVTSNGGVAGTQYVDSGARSYATVIYSGGKEIVESYDDGAMISGGGVQDLEFSGVGFYAQIASGAVQSVIFASAYYANIAAGGVQTVIGGFASGTVINGGMQDVSYSGFAYGTNVRRGTELVYSGGVAFNGMVSAQQVLSSGGVDSGSVFYNGATQSVLVDGVASDSVFTYGAQQTVFSGGVANGAVLSSGGVQLVTFSGNALYTSVGSGGQEIVVASGTAYYSEAQAGGTVKLEGGFAYGTTVAAVGLLDVLNSGYAEFSLVTGVSGSLVVSSGGISYGAKVIAGFASETVRSGGRSVIAEISGGGFEITSSGGQSADTNIAEGGSAVVSAGGVGQSQMISSGGAETILSKGMASSTAVLASGRLNVQSGGVALGTTIARFGMLVNRGTTSKSILNGGVELVSAGGKSIGEVVNSGGEMFAYGGTVSAATVNTGGLLSVNQAATVAGGFILSGGEAIIGGAVAAGQTIKFAGAGELYVMSGASIAATISGFNNANEKIDLGGFTYNSATESVKFTPATSGNSGTVTVTDGSQTISLALLGKYVTSNFTLSSDGDGGSFVTDPPAKKHRSAGASTVTGAAADLAATMVWADTQGRPVAAARNAETPAAGPAAITLSDHAQITFVNFWHHPSGIG